MKRRNNYKIKREALWQLILRAFAVSTALTLVFALVWYYILMQYIRTQCREQIRHNLSNMLEYTSQSVQERDENCLFNQIAGKYTINQIMDIVLDDPLHETQEEPASLQIVPWYNKDCDAATVLIAEDGTIVASSRRKLCTMLLFEKGNPENGIYICDNEQLHIPEVDKLYADYEERFHKGENYVDIAVTSIYVDKETHTFIPHEGTMTVYDDIDVYEALFESSNGTVIPFSVTIDDPDYELIEVHPRLGNYPCAVMANFHGTDPSSMTEFEQERPFNYVSDFIYSTSGSRYTSDGKAVFEESTHVYINNAPYYLVSRFIIDEHMPAIMRYYRMWIIRFAGFVLILAALWVWRRHTVNRARYAFEDMRRDLTDHLAHDIKTPLTAIGGYTENILDGSLTPEEQERYLHSILDNVAFTDTLISRTLQLNRTDAVPQKREKLAVAPILKENLRKYEPMLAEKHINFTVSGEAEWLCDRAGLETILENLLSNAVKYTPENGSIRAEIGRTRLTLTNTVSGQISVKGLKTPFVRGNAARSNADGCGLGLSLADRGAAANGWKLRLSCTDKAFTAVLG